MDWSAMIEKNKEKILQTVTDVYFESLDDPLHSYFVVMDLEENLRSGKQSGLIIDNEVWNGRAIYLFFSSNFDMQVSWSEYFLMGGSCAADAGKVMEKYREETGKKVLCVSEIDGFDMFLKIHFPDIVLDICRKEVEKIIEGFEVEMMDFQEMLG